MIASGWKTAPPQVGSEVVLVTNPACTSSLEASPVSPIAIFFSHFASTSGALWTQIALSLNFLQHSSVYTASRSHTLSAPSVSGT